jgi:hypothetical protein
MMLEHNRIWPTRYVLPLVQKLHYQVRLERRFGYRLLKGTYRKTLIILTRRYETKVHMMSMEAKDGTPLSIG